MSPHCSDSTGEISVFWAVERGSVSPFDRFEIKYYFIYNCDAYLDLLDLAVGGTRMWNHQTSL
jgi:hypothetical protein